MRRSSFPTHKTEERCLSAGHCATKTVASDWSPIRTQVLYDVTCTATFTGGGLAPCVAAPPPLPLIKLPPQAQRGCCQALTLTLHCAHSRRPCAMREGTPDAVVAQLPPDPRHFLDQAPPHSWRPRPMRRCMAAASTSMAAAAPAARLPPDPTPIPPPFPAAAD